MANTFSSRERFVTKNKGESKTPRTASRIVQTQLPHPELVDDHRVSVAVDDGLVLDVASAVRVLPFRTRLRQADTASGGVGDGIPYNERQLDVLMGVGNGGMGDGARKKP